MFAPGLIDRLPKMRGRYIGNASLAKKTWFRVGGPAEVLFTPADREDLLEFLCTKPKDIPLTVIGVGSNLLVRDGGVPGVVAQLGRGLSHVVVEGEQVIAEAGAFAHAVAKACQRACLSGLEFLIGIPGLIGGALRMNAGAYGREMQDITITAEIIDPSGSIHIRDHQALGFRYRGCAVPEQAIFLSATFQGQKGSTEEILERMQEIQDQRQASQPIRLRTGGSTFANPPGIKAWKLIERADCRGMTRGGAQVSKHHCNFLINTGNATAADLESLGEEVRQRVRAVCGVTLDWEIRRVGIPNNIGSHISDPLTGEHP